MFISLKRIVKSGWISFTRNGTQNVATVFIMAITVFFVTLLFILNLASQRLLLNLQEKVDISIYFKEEISEDDILQAKDELSDFPEVKNVEYVSKKQALDKFIERHKSESVLMESLAQVGENPFLASLNIQAWQISQYESLCSSVEKASFQDDIYKVDYFERKPLIERVSSVVLGVNKIGIISTLVLAVLAVLVAFNTIRLAIYNSREEISVMRLVGASNWFIQGPFLIQGSIAGFVAVLIALFLSLAGSYFVAPKIEFMFPGFNIWEQFIASFWTILLIQVATGIGLGMLSSLIATRKYLKV